MKRIILVLAIALLLIGCTTKELDDSLATKEMISEIAEANNQFAFDFYNKIDGDENLFFSPSSISTVLSIAAEGSNGQTYEEMKQVLHFPDERKYGNAGVYNLINKRNKKYQLSTANALWLQKSFPIKEDFLDTSKNYYGAEIKNLDFSKQTQSANEINQWIEKETNNKIKDMVSPGSISVYTRLVITNAIYFKGKWKEEFEKSETFDEDFYITKNDVAQVPTMHLSGDDANFNYFGNEEFQTLKLPYLDNEVSMTIILPKDMENFSFDYDKYVEFKIGMRNQNIILSLPKFKFETKYSLKEQLSEMGMPTAFNETEADFKGITEAEELFISKVIHQAYIDVNEEGTEAAAATFLMMDTSAAIIRREPIVFKVDKPFIFIIEHKETNEILFMGKVMDPREK